MSVDEKLSNKKAEIMAYLKSDFRYSHNTPRPFIIEFNGSPHSGKTTTIIEIDKFLRRHGFRVLRPQESGEAIRHIDRSSPIYNIRTGLYTLTNLLDNIHSHNYDIILYDRGVFDAYCWMSYWFKQRKITKKQSDNIQNFFLSNTWTDEIDRVYFMICSAEESKKREFNTSISKKLDTKNVEIAKFYRNAYNRLSKRFSRIKLIDTTNLDKKEVIRAVVLDILDTMECKIKKKD